MFGLDRQQVQESAAILRDLAVDWRELVASREGFLTGEGRRGLHRHGVAWGDMVLLPALGPLRLIQLIR